MYLFICILCCSLYSSLYILRTNVGCDYSEWIRKFLLFGGINIIMLLMGWFILKYSPFFIQFIGIKILYILMFLLYIIGWILVINNQSTNNIFSSYLIVHIIWILFWMSLLISKIFNVVV